MANLTPKTINELPALSSMSDADLMAVSSSSAAKRITWANMKNSIISAVLPYSSDNCTLADGVTASGTPVFTLQKCGKTVALRLSVDVTSGLAANTFTTIATIPAGYVPRAQVTNVCMTGSETIGMLTATTGGNVRVAPNTAFSSSDTANIRCELVWFVS